jgi:hypothetical protein
LIWEQYSKNIAPYERLTPAQIDKIEMMFEWEWLRKIIVDERVAKKAVEISRNFGMRPADSIHAASAVLKKVDALQRWDRDFDKVKHLVNSEEPKTKTMSSQPPLIADYAKSIGPHPDDFEPPSAISVAAKVPDEKGK